MAEHPFLTDLPVRPTLRPGFHVVRRDDGHLQVGIDSPERVVVADLPDVRRLLADLRAGTYPASLTPAAQACLLRLVEVGLVVDADQLARAGTNRAAVAAALAQHGPGAGRRLAARAGARVAVLATRDALASVSRLLQAAGVGVVSAESGAADVHLVVVDGELLRDRVDPLVRDGSPHLLVTGAGGGIVLGPFVVPGVTACLRCVDAQLAESDPRRAVVVEQAARACAMGGDAPSDPVLQALALAWAVRDVVTFVEGGQPATWSATVRVDPDLSLERRSWRRHLHCGCAWADAVAG